MSAPVPFTQYMRPHGRPVPVSVEVSDDVAAKAQTIMRRGLVFECEVLSGGQVSLTITDPEEGDLAFQIVPNGPGMVEAVEALIRKFTA